MEAAGRLFVEATATLQGNPRSEEARGVLIDAARGLLAGTTSMLMTFDAFEVRKIVKLGEQVIDQLNAALVGIWMWFLFCCCVFILSINLFRPPSAPSPKPSNRASRHWMTLWPRSSRCLRR